MADYCAASSSGTQGYCAGRRSSKTWPACVTLRRISCSSAAPSTGFRPNRSTNARSTEERLDGPRCALCAGSAGHARNLVSLLCPFLGLRLGLVVLRLSGRQLAEATKVSAGDDVPCGNVFRGRDVDPTRAAKNSAASRTSKRSCQYALLACCRIGRIGILSLANWAPLVLRESELYVVSRMDTLHPLVSLVRALLLAFLVMAGPMLSAGQAGHVEAVSEASDVAYADYPPCEASEFHSDLKAGCNPGSSCQVQALSDAFFPVEFTSSASVTASSAFSSRSITISPNLQPPKLASRI